MPRRASPPSMVALSAAAIGSSFLLGAQVSHAASGDRIGDAVSITNVVLANFEAQQRQLSSGDDVRQDETIEVDRDAQGQLKLEDNTKLALGPGSRLVLDKFVYDSEKRSGSIILNLTKGAFRFITGVAAKPTYVINTPNASITVRGTIFDVYVLSDNSVWLLLQEGALEATGAKNVCRVLDRPGQLIHVSSDGAVNGPINWPQLPGNTSVAFDTAFPFVTNVPQIDTTQILSRDEIVAGAFPIGPQRPCVNPHAPIEIRTLPPIRKAEMPPPLPPQLPRVAPAEMEDLYDDSDNDRRHWHLRKFGKHWKFDDDWKLNKDWKINKRWKFDKHVKHDDDDNYRDSRRRLERAAKLGGLLGRGMKKVLSGHRDGGYGNHWKRGY